MRLVAYTDAKGWGGAEVCLGNLLAELRPDVEATVVARSPDVAEALAERRPGTGTRVVGPSVREHRRALAALRPDVVHVNQNQPFAATLGLLAGLTTRGARVVIVDHLPIPGESRRQKASRPVLARRAAARVAVGERCARLIEKYVGLPAGSVEAIANGVPPAPGPQAAPAAGAPVVGAVGRLTDQKGFDALVRALPGLPDVRAVIVGDGPEREALTALAGELGVADRLEITGWTAHPREHLACFSVLAVPSRWEGMPLVVLEAMHAGVPVVATDVGSIAEAVSDGRTGFVVAPGDEEALRDRLARVLADGDLRARLGEQARADAAQRFTADAMARRYEALYDRVLGG